MSHYVAPIYMNIGAGCSLHSILGYRDSHNSERGPRCSIPISRPPPSHFRVRCDIVFSHEKEEGERKTLTSLSLDPPPLISSRECEALSGPVRGPVLRKGVDRFDRGRGRTDDCGYIGRAYSVSTSYLQIFGNSCSLFGSQCGTPTEISI